MSLRFKRGTSNLDGIVFLAFLIFILLAGYRNSGSGGKLFSVPQPANGNGAGTTISSRSDSNRTTSGGVLVSPTIQAAGYPDISISRGNAGREIQSYREYITISNWGKAPVDITSWTLRNGKDKRTYSIGDQLQRFSADIAQIPKAAPLLLPSGGSPLQNVVLKSGERAIITTGRVTVNSPYPITSFKENMCTGYLERLDDYNFEPALQTSCPDPEDEPGIERLDTQCRAFVESLSRCTTPKFERKDREGNACENCIENKILSSSCAAYVREHFSYKGCIAYHAGGPNFSSGKTWRVFLGRGWEMWGKNYETIELFDQYGNLAAFSNY